MSGATLWKRNFMTNELDKKSQDYLNKLEGMITKGLEDLKAADIVSIFIGDVSTVADKIMIASGTSNRHLNAIIASVNKEARDNNIDVICRQGDSSTGWVLIDFGDIVCHVMLPEMRALYDLERLWTARPDDNS
jgi:ribosome-associated protein